MGAQIYAAKDDSLEERILAYQAALQAMKNLEECLSLSKNKEWENRLGSREEMKDAQKTIDESLKAAKDSIEPSEIKMAEKKELLSKEEARNLALAMRDKIAEIRKQEAANKHKSNSIGSSRQNKQ